MAHLLVSLGLNDLRSVRRDSMLVGIAVVPLVMVLSVRLIVPPATSSLAEQGGIQAESYYPLFLSLFFLLNIPLLFGALAGFLILDDRDDDSFTALRVTPISVGSYISYRLGAAFVLSVLYTVVCTPLTGLMPLSLLPALVAASLVAGLSVPFTALLLNAFAGNKVEALALSKGIGLLMLGQIGAYFVQSELQLVFGILPTFWPAKVFWTASAGLPIWPYLLVGLAYHLLLIGWVYRRFRARLYR